MAHYFKSEDLGVSKTVPWMSQRQVNSFKVMYNEGYAWTDIIERFGFSQVTGIELAKELGLKPREFRKRSI